MADERHKVPNAADEQQLRRGSAYIQETFGVSPFELYARHSPDRDRVVWVLVGELRDAARRLDSMHEEFDTHARWIERDLAHARGHPDRINPLGVLQSSGATVERNAACMELAGEHLRALTSIYKIAVGAASDSARERGFDRGRRTQKDLSRPRETSATETLARPSARRGAQPVPPVIAASPPPAPRGRR